MTEAQAQDILIYFKDMQEAQTELTILFSTMMAIALGFWIWQLIVEIKKAKTRKAFLSSLPEDQQKTIERYKKLQ